MFKEVSVVARGMKITAMAGSKWEQWWVYTNAFRNHMVGKTPFPLPLRTEEITQRTQYP